MNRFLTNEAQSPHPHKSDGREVDGVNSFLFLDPDEAWRSTREVIGKDSGYPKVWRGCQKGLRGFGSSREDFYERFGIGI